MAKRIAILGAGESGIGAALLARREGFEVFVSDMGKIKDTYAAVLRENSIPFEQEKHTFEYILNADKIVKSPGIPDEAPLVKEAISRGIPVVSEIEFAGKHTTSKIIGITGSNGKTTTTKLTHHLLVSAGMDAGIGGNVGYSFAKLLTETPKAWYVLEISSFQLDGIRDFRPDISILLNITPDHLDRYGYKMENYIASKFRIALNQRPEDVLIYNADNANISEYLAVHPLQVRLDPVRDGFFRNGRLYVDEHTSFDMTQCSLKGPHNMFNAICAVKAALLAGAGVEGIQEGLNTFVNVPHRLEFVGTVQGVDYINDSKATNVDSVFWALQAMEKPTVLILGGQDKGNDYGAIRDLVREKVKAIVCMGVDNHKIVDYFSPFMQVVVETGSAQDAVAQSARLAQEGDTVLLSPACASFDLFKNYEHRGDVFREEVKKLV